MRATSEDGPSSWSPSVAQRREGTAARALGVFYDLRPSRRDLDEGSARWMEDRDVRGRRTTSGARIRGATGVMSRKNLIRIRSTEPS